jgi:drug/metabolite transporter (DMT)-like permease
VIGVAEALALLAAALYGLGTVLEQRGALEATAGATDPRFYGQILRRPAWLAGIGVTALGGLAQVIALAHGSLVVVQPILMLSLVFALPFGIWLTDQRVGRREVVGAVVVVAGLAVFLRVASPHGGVTSPTTGAWVAGIGIVGAVAAAFTVASRGRRPGLSAALLGVAAGACFGLAAALSKQFTTYAPQGVGVVLGEWITYAMVVSALAGGILQQAALKTGVLPSAMASINVANLLSSIAIGLTVFQETLAHGHGTIAMALAAIAATIAGVITLVGNRRADGLGSPRQRGNDSWLSGR